MGRGLTKSVVAVAIISMAFVMDSQAQSLPLFSSDLFAGSGDCAFCHSADTGVLSDADGNDVSPPFTWRGTMMANASNDPYWRAKVSAETAAYPLIAGPIEDKCTTCHAPMARTEAHYNGADAYRLTTLVGDAVALDGVSCTLCHQIDSSNMGETDSFSGHYVIDAKRLIYGPYSAPLTAQMQNRVNYTPTQSMHIESSELCATCHTLYTSHVDVDGNLTGNFPEQTPYLEWRNSVYPGRGETCQACHMQSVDEPTVISIRPFSLTTERQPVWRHDFAGGNTLLPKIMRDNAAEIGTTVLSSDFDTIAASALNMLAEKSVKLVLSSHVEGDTLLIDVNVKNLAGHKLPTGFPSRRAWINLRVTNDSGTDVFESGAWNSDGNPIGVDEGYEPHRNIIVNAGQVQIYEAIMGDTDGLPTSTLLAAAQYLKDNRLPPEGFSDGGYGYEDTAPTGAAVTDADFNLDAGGDDTVHYHVPLNSPGEHYTVDVRMCYSSISEPFVAHLNETGTPESAAFLSYHANADTSPTIIAAQSMTVVSTGVQREGALPELRPKIMNYPNPFNRQTSIRVYVPDSSDIELTIRNSTGQIVRTIADRRLDKGQHTFRWNATDDGGIPVASGIYICDLRVGMTAVSHRLSYLK